MAKSRQEQDRAERQRAPFNPPRTEPPGDDDEPRNEPREAPEAPPDPRVPPPPSPPPREPGPS